MSIIEVICKQLMAEAQAVLDYTKDLEATMEIPTGKQVSDLLDDIRIDEVEHIQKLALALTSCFFETGEKSSGEQDKKEGEEGDAE